jgi:hypothetical protein
MFGGGVANGSTFTYVDAYSPALVRSNINMSQQRTSLAATTVGGYALFGGGATGRQVDAFNAYLVLTTTTGLSPSRDRMAATTVEGYGLFGGGSILANFSGSNTVDAYSTSLVRSTPTPLSQERADLAATTVGGYALFGGGNDGGSTSLTVDAYTVGGG